MRELFRPLLLMTVVVLVPVLPFLAFGSAAERWVEQWRAQPLAAPTTALLVMGLLSTDIFLPIPSSLVSTLGGAQLGAVGGTATSWMGMSAGAAFGFALARRWGKPLALRLTTGDDLAKMKRLSDRFGAAVLILARGVPVMAEASVLLVGIHELSWRRFLPPVLFSNFALALAYSAFGDYAQQQQWLALAIGVSIALPVLLAAVATRWMPGDKNGQEAARSGDKSP